MTNDILTSNPLAFPRLKAHDLAMEQEGVHWRKLEASGTERFESAGSHYACTTVEPILGW